MLERIARWFRSWQRARAEKHYVEYEPVKVSKYTMKPIQKGGHSDEAYDGGRTYEDEAPLTETREYTVFWNHAADAGMADLLMVGRWCPHGAGDFSEGDIEDIPVSLWNKKCTRVQSQSVASGSTSAGGSADSSA